MKKLLCMLLISAMLLSLASCGSEKDNVTNNPSSENWTQTALASQGGAAEKEPQTPSSEPVPGSDGIDVDLTKLSSTMVYSEVYNMMYAPDDYIEKTVKMKGQFAYYKEPETKNQYFSCIITDAAACCSQGLEFVLSGKHTYPDDYPELGSEITVTGTFEVYEENGYKYCRLADANFSD